MNETQIEPAASGPVRRHWQKTLGWYVVLVLGVFLSPPAHALTCGTQLMTSVTLTADLVCTNSVGLEVGADNILIDLNGHTISCINPAGYLGSCQVFANAPPGFVPGIVFPGNGTSGRHNVVIRGPGTITGFTHGVEIYNGHGIVIEGVTITGPTIPKSVDFINQRGPTQGVEIQNSRCNTNPFAPGWTAVVQFNDISNQTYGINLQGASCVLVNANQIHDNGGPDPNFGSFGVLLNELSTTGGHVPSSNNFIFENTITRNGVNEKDNAGILISASFQGQAANNVVSTNNVSGNCGDGIAVADGASNNNISQNIVLNNSTSTYGGQCHNVLPGMFFDVDAIFAGPGNIWNTNNVCKTKSAGIPAGVCI
jgi:parallel beta-helix repeat protein